LDYQRIYSAFIASRKAIEHTHEGYTEKHHIVPRSLGGSDDRENLVKLTPEDHFFAHLLLAKATNSAKAWAACMILAGARKSGRRPEDVRRGLVRHRKVFALVRRQWAEASRGEAAANADLTIYTFFHKDGGKFTGTRIAFSSFTGIPSVNRDPLVRGEVSSSFGWAMSIDVASSIDRVKTEKATAAGKMLRGYIRDKKVYPFFRESDGLLMVARQSAMVKLGYISNTGVSSLCMGKRFSASGWCLLENSDWAFDRSRRSGRFSGAYISEEFTFVNSETGEEVRSTAWEMGKNLNGGDSRPFAAVASGARSGWRGWHIIGSKKPRVWAKEYKFVRSSDGNEIIGSTSELAAILGVTRSSVYRAARGYAPHVKGYSICDKR
jgi:hypothetical protein